MKPKLRTLDVQPSPEGYLLRDPYGVSDQVLVLSPEAMYLATLLDGTRDATDIQALVLKQSGSVLSREKIEELIEALARAGFLEDEQTQKKLAEAERSFLSRPRPMALAGQSYPREAEAFRAHLKAFEAFAPEVPEAPLKGLLMPHLEPRRVPEVYGAAFKALALTPAPERTLILGVAHRPIGAPAAALALDFETPLGTLKADVEALTALDALLGFELFNTPLAFREEHSVEFPAVYLKAYWPKTRILPVIVGSDDETALRELAEALALLKRDRPYFPLLSVDLSHVGGRFGHGGIEATLKADAERTDRAYLEALARGDHGGAYQALAARGNRTFIDAMGPGLAASRVLEGEGRVLAYRLSPEIETLSAVGAGTVGWY